MATEAMGRRGIAATILVAALGCAAGCASPAPRAPAAPAASGSSATAGASRTAVLLAINDVYRVAGVEEGSRGGLARVRALRRELERQAPDLLLLHAGDFLFPSFESRMYKGEQMIDALNRLDGQPGVFDPRMLVDFGNHEFEDRKSSTNLAARIAQSEFRWLDGNITFLPGPAGAPAIASDKLAASVLVESGGIRVGVFGLTIPRFDVPYVTFDGPIATARRLTAALRAEGAEVVVALTHLNASDDRQLLEELGDAGPDVLIGGHDHERQAFQAGGRWAIKADADARTATVVRLTLDGAGRLEVHHEFRALSGANPAPDPDLLARAEEWKARHSKEFCASKSAPPDCLEERYGATRTVLDAEEEKIRGEESGFGDWIGDLMVEAFAGCGAQVAFVNGGSLRLNQDIAAGSVLTRRQIEELFGYPAPLYLVRLDGATLQSVAEQSVRGWPGSGSWLQIAGFAFRHNATARAALDLTLLGSSPHRPRPDEPILGVTNDFLINPESGDQDGYLMLDRSRIVDCPKNGVDLKELVVAAIHAAEPGGIAPAKEGRICQDPKAPCRALSN